MEQPLPWYIAGILIGIVVPVLLLLGNKTFGVSSSMRHICASCVPANIKFFKYDWKKEIWNLFFIAGIFGGALAASLFWGNSSVLSISENTLNSLRQYGLSDFSGHMPAEIFSLTEIFSLRTLVFIVFGGLLVGFGTRYAGGCTSGHAIMGLSNFQMPSLIATISFMGGGFIMVHLLMPLLFKLTF